MREHVQSAVDRQTVSDVPIGAFLSGGLDSSSVAACAVRTLGGRPFDCFTMGFTDRSFHEEGAVDDLPYARLAARHLGVDLHTIHAGPEMADELQRMVYFLDEPQADLAAINTFFICKSARERGVKVLLSGSGGDDIFSGYRRHRALRMERFWSWLPLFARTGLKRFSSWLPTSPALTRRIAKTFSYAHLDGDARLASYFQMGMMAGVEVRVPLLDPDLMSLAARLPTAYKQPIGGSGKWILKAAMKPMLPSEVIHRSKSGFGVPLRHWLRNELRPVVEDTLSDASLRRRGLFDSVTVRRLVNSDRSGAIDAAYTLLSLICIELWCRTFVDASAPSAP